MKTLCAALLLMVMTATAQAKDAISAQPKRFGRLASHKIAVIGHSLGGWTALEIGGARFDPQRFAEDCKAHPVLAGCRV